LGVEKLKYRINAKHDLDRQTIYRFLSAVVDILRSEKVNEVSVVFGFAWANDFNMWKSMLVLTDDLIPLVEFVESRGHGSLSQDDLTVKLPMLTIELCHDGGVHVRFDSKSELVTGLYTAMVKDGLLYSVEAHKDALVVKDDKYWQKHLEKKRNAWIPIEFSQCE
jgi:hypothetical protein